MRYMKSFIITVSHAVVIHPFNRGLRYEGQKIGDWQKYCIFPVIEKDSGILQHRLVRWGYR